MHKTFRHTLPVFSLLLLLLIAQSRVPVHAFGGDNALEFRDNSYVRLGIPGTDTEDTIFGGTQDWANSKSVSVWIRPLQNPNPSIAGDVGLLEHIVGNSPRWFGISRGTLQSVNQDRIWVWNTYQSGVSTLTSIIGIEYEVGKWINITLVHNNTTLSAYKNGVLVGSVPTGQTLIPNPNSTNRYLAFGGSRLDRDNFYGQLDEVAFWNINLTSQQIREWIFREIDLNHPLWSSNLSAYYKLSNGSGTTVSDNGPNNFTGTFYTSLSGFPRWTTSGAFAGPRNALTFDGGDDYVSLGVGSNGSTVIGAGWASTKSLELWAKPAGAAPIVGTAAAGKVLFAGTNWGISQADLGSSSKLYVWNNDGSEDTLPIDYTAGEWVHVTLVHDGINLTAYRNGVNVGSIASGSTASDGDLFIGGFSGGQRFEGQIDEVRLWRDARTQTEIQDNMFATVAHDASDLAAYYRMDQENDSTVTTVYDSAETPAAAHNGTMINMAPASAWVASTAFNTWIGGDSGDWASGGNWSRYAAPTSSSNVGLTSYPASNAPTISAESFARNLVISSGATLNVNSGGSLRADGLWLNNGTLNNSGTLEQVQAVDGSSAVQFFANGNYGPITIDGNGYDLGSTTVRVRALANCTTGPELTVQRCIDIAPTNSPDSGNGDPGSILTFSFLSGELNSNDCNTLNAYHWNDINSQWDVLTVSSQQCVTSPYQLEVTGVTDFSPFMLTSDNNPTAVSLQTISAKQSGWWASLLASSLLLIATGGLLILRRKKADQTQ